MAVLPGWFEGEDSSGRYTLQEDTNKYRGSDVPCPLCKVAPENMYHFLFVCTELSEVPRKIPQVDSRNSYYNNSSCNTNWERIIKSPELQEKLLVDPDSPELGVVDPDSTFSIGSVARLYNVCPPYHASQETRAGRQMKIQLVTNLS